MSIDLKRRCNYSYCIVDQALSLGLKQVWPLDRLRLVSVQSLMGLTVAEEWRVYFGYNNGAGRKKVGPVCISHHDQLFLVAAQEMRLDVREQEATDVWLTKTGGRMWID